ncbi:hypothetical protein [Arcticibacter sp. MXS-1]|uniref:hypothetical protein n=1 Tax=Arcticibacter sp. MXS-1 TaxID=3341726 RepID=UPI0035A9A6AE
MKQTLTLILSSFLYLIAYQSYGQKKFLTGEVTFKNGTVRKGFIKYENWNINPRKIEFKDSTTTPATTLTAEQINAFTITTEEIKENYQLYAVRIDTSDQTLENMSQTIKPEPKELSLFLQKLVSGKVSLFNAKISSSRNHYFTIKDGHQPEELLHKQYKIGSAIAENSYFREQLMFLLDDCPVISALNIKKLRYLEKELVNVISEYNRCINGESPQDFRRKDYKLAPVFSVFVEPSYNKLSVSTDSFDLLARFKGSIGLSAGLTTEFFIPRSDKRTSLFIDLGYKNYRFKGDNEPRHVFSFRDEIETHFHYGIFNIGVRKYLGGRVIKPFADLKFSNAFLLANDRLVRRYRQDTGGQQSTFSYFQHIRKHEQGGQLTIGGEVGKVDIGATFGISNGFSGYMSTKTTIHRTGLSLRYKF